jgi:hypothetical protein
MLHYRCSTTRLSCRGATGLRFAQVNNHFSMNSVGPTPIVFRSQHRVVEKHALFGSGQALVGLLVRRYVARVFADMFIVVSFLVSISLIQGSP